MSSNQKGKQILCNSWETYRPKTKGDERSWGPKALQYLRLRDMSRNMQRRLGRKS